MSDVQTWTGGCQCGAIRFAATQLGRASMCHCRMCQKAFGGPGGALVAVKGLTWTRGTPKRFASSNRVERGFCGDCGTPLTFEVPSAALVDIAIATFDRAKEITPTVQIAADAALPWTGALTTLPGIPTVDTEKARAWFSSIVSHQHPDDDTAAWPAKKTQ